MYIYILQGNIFLYIFKKLTITVFLLQRNDTNHTSGETIFILFISECHRGQKKKNRMKCLVSVYFSRLFKFKIQSRYISVYKST